MVGVRRGKICPGPAQRSKGVDGRAPRLRRVFSGIGEVADAFVDIDVEGVVRHGQMTGIEQFCAEDLNIVRCQGVVEDRQQVVDADGAGTEGTGVIEAGVHEPSMDIAPAIAEIVRLGFAEVEAPLTRVLEDGNSIGHAPQEHIDSMSPQLGRVEAVEEDGASAALGVP